MAGDVRLDLQVGLDLAFLQNQLSTIGTRLGGQSISLPVQFNSQSISQGLNQLQQRIGRRKFDVKIESNTLEALSAKVQKFQERLRQLQGDKIKLDLTVGGIPSIGRDEARKIRTGLKRQILAEGGKIRIETSILPKITQADVDSFTSAVKAKLKGISVDVKVNPSVAKASAIPAASPAVTTAPTVQPVTGAISLSKRDAANIRKDLTLAILDGNKKIFIPTSIKPSITQKDVRDFENAAKSRLAGLSVRVKGDLVVGAVRRGAKSQADIDNDVRRGLQAISEMGAARMQGAPAAGVTEAARRASLRSAIEGMTVTQLKTVAGQLQVGGVSRLRKADIIEKIVTDASIDMVRRYLDPQAVMRNPNRRPLEQVLNTFARGVMHMLGMDPATLREQARQRRLPPAINWPAQAPPPAPLAGPSSTGRLLTGAPAPSMLAGFMPAGLLPSMTQRTATARGVEAIISNALGGRAGGGRGGELVDAKRIYAALQKNIDEILRRTFTVVEVDVRETSATLRTALRSFSYLAQSLREAEARAKTARIDAAVDSLMRRIEETIRTAQARLRVVPAQVSNLGAPAPRMLQAQRIAGLLPPGVGRTSSNYVTADAYFEKQRAAMFARREQEARARSAFRELTMGQHFTQQRRLPGTTFMGDEFTAGGGLDRVRGSGYQYVAPRQGHYMSPSIRAQVARVEGAYVPRAVRDAVLLDPSRRDAILRGDSGAAGVSTAAFLETLDRKTATRLSAGYGNLPIGGGGGVFYSSGGFQTYRGGFPVDTMLGPSSPIGRGGGSGYQPRGAGQSSDRGGAIVPYTPTAPSSALPRAYFTGMQFANALKGSEALLNKARIPLASAMQELGGEFAEATKQVLLYGTAYKALAFVMDLPRQTLAAATALQTFRNQLLAITGSAEGVDRSFNFIDNLVNRFAVPLESARTGFTKLYASMAPAGFSPKEIENLFTGVSKASATFGLSADKVDRVTYALSQMGSKGQIMAEELRGQLGDVLPGAMAIFAEAAQMDIPTFTKAMEDGAFKGEAMRVVLNNVGILMNNKFATGATGAAKTLQGSLNQMQTGLNRFYEAFEPIVSSFATSLAPVIQETMRDATLAITALADRSGSAMQSIPASARPLLSLFQQLGSILQNTGQALLNFSGVFSRVGAVIVPVVQLMSQFIAIPVVGRVMGYVAAIALLTSAFKLLASTGILSATAAMIRWIVTINIAQVRAYIAGLFSMVRAFFSMTTALKAAELGFIALRVAAFSVVGTAILAGLDAVITKVMGIGSAAESAAQRTRRLVNELETAATMGDVPTVSAALGTANEEVTSLTRARNALQKILDFDFAKKPARLSKEEIRSLRATGGATGLFIDEKTGQVIGGSGRKRANLDSVTAGLKEALNRAGQIKDQLETAVDMAASTRRTQQELQPLPALGSDEAKAKKTEDNAKRAADKAAEDARRMADEKRKYDSELMRMSAAQAMELDNVAFENWKSLQDQKFSYMEAGANEWMKTEIKLQRDLQKIEIDRIDAIRKARQETQKAEVEANAKAYVAQEGMPFKGGGAISGGAAKFGDTGRTFNAAGWVHGHFQNMDRGALIRDTTEVVMKLLERGVPTELGSGRKFQRGMNRSQVEGIVKQGIAAHKKYVSGVGAIDVFVPQGTEVPVPLGSVGNLGGAAGVTGTLPGGTQLMHLAQGSKSSAVGNAARQRKEFVKDRQAQLAVVDALNRKDIERLEVQFANEDAQRKVNIAIREYVASIAPVEQQKLENSLLQERVRLLGSGVYGEALDTQMKTSEAEMRRTLGVRLANQAINENQSLIKANDAAVKAGTKTTGQANAENEVYAANIAINTLKINELNKATQDYIPTLQEKLRLTQQAAEAELMGSIQRATPFGGMGLSAGFIGDAASRYEEAIGRGASQQEASRFAELQNQLTLLETRNNAIKSSILGIGDAFGTAMTTGIASVIDGTASAQEVFANFLKSIGQSLLQAAQQMIATYIAIGIARIFAGLGGAGAGAGKGSDLASSFTGKFDLSGTSFATMPKTFGFANGGIASGGFKAFASGGVATSPTLGLIGEGKYNEAIVPLPDGKSIPVMMRGEQPRSRDLLSGGAMNKAMAPILSMSFQTTTINGTEYVSREQLEQAMMETRKAAASEGASRGASLAIDRLQQSPNTRRRIGIR